MEASQQHDHQNCNGIQQTCDTDQSNVKYPGHCNTTVIYAVLMLTLIPQFFAFFGFISLTVKAIQLGKLSEITKQT